MANQAGIEEKHAILMQILPEYEPISRAPQCAMDFDNTTRERFNKYPDQFEAWKRTESKKLYKAINWHGTVFLIPNPWTIPEIKRGEHTSYLKITPAPYMTWEDAKEAARKRTPSRQESAFNV